MHGWEVRTFADLPVQHHRRVSSGAGGLVRTKIRHGMRHYCLGYHPVFELVRCVYRIPDRPYFIGSALMACGYALAWMKRTQTGVPPEAVRYLRSEQIDKLRAMFIGREWSRKSACSR